MYRIIKREMTVEAGESAPPKLNKSFFCSACHSQFFIKDLILKGSRYPMLLQCGHSVCEPCLQRNQKSIKAIVCQHCGLSYSLESVDQISKCFPLNTYIVGSILVLQNARNEYNKKLAFLKTNNGNFNYAVKYQSTANLKTETFNTACEECSLEAPWYCENCKSNFCELCWSKVHGLAKTLMKHSRVPIGSCEISRNNLKRCPKHETHYLEFYCNGCSIPVCSYCIILQHQGEGHCPVTMEEKNMEILGKVKTAAEEAEKVKKLMSLTLEKVKLTQSSSGISNLKLYSDLENQITRNFSRLHGVLQLEEDRLLKKLHEKSNECESALEAVSSQLKQQMEYVEGLLREYEFAVKKPRSNDLTDLYKELLEVENLPCHLISQEADSKETMISFNEKVIEQLQMYCKVDLPSEKTFELRSSSQLPADYVVEPLNTSNFDERLRDMAKAAGQESSASDIDTLSNCSSRDFGKGNLDPPLPIAGTERKGFQEKKSYSVRLSYIKNPGEFYVTLNSQRFRRQAIDKKACKCGNTDPVIPETVSKDEVYLVKYIVDNKWYRGRVIEFHPGKEMGDEDYVRVCYIDYGNSETVPLSRLRHIPPDMLEPPLAVKCKLFDCVPKSGVWCMESTKTMEKILDNYTATMFVMKVHQDCLEVDLSVIYPDGQIGRDIVSVRDALMFLEFSIFVHGPVKSNKANSLKYQNWNLPSIGEKFNVVITHVNSPSDFYIQRQNEDEPYLCKLLDDMRKYYNENLGKGVIYNPTTGTPCAARWSDQWFRAKIVDIPGKKTVTVLNVDCGRKLTLPWMNIRKLKETFMKRPPVAFHCKLTGIHPTDAAWNEQSKLCLEKRLMVRGECCVQVHNKPKANQKLKVLLFVRENGKEICVNAMFVSLGYAVRTTTSYLWNLESRADEEDECDRTPPEKLALKTNAETQKWQMDEDAVSSDGGNASLTKGRYFEERKKNKPSAKKLREMHEFKKKNSTVEEGSTGESESEVDEYNNVIKVKVEILLAESPSSIYVTLPSLNVEFKKLQSMLCEFYNDSSAPGRKWKADDICVVFDSEKCCWYRATVLSVLPDDRVKVFLKDVAKISIVPALALRELDPTFAKYATCAVKCHLSNIIPPGEEWPSISSEFLINELENYKEVYMTKRGQIENKSLPVELWVKKLVPKGALEPITKEWVTLNRLLVNQGLAIPLKQKMLHPYPASKDCVTVSEKIQEPSVETPLDEEETSKESDTFTPSLSSRWLPSEPLKMSRFLGIPTYVDYNAFIYVFNVEEDEEKLKTINESLMSEYESSKPNPEDHFWSVGQLCIARYHLDNAWYRGLILETNKDSTYDVLFVDYGNVETCQTMDLRKKIKMHEIPVLTHKCQLQGISSTSGDGSWSVSTIDVLHSLIVDKRCEVEVVKPAPDLTEPYIVSLKLLESDIDVTEFLIQKGLAVPSWVDGSVTSDLETDKGNASQTWKLSYDVSIPLYIPINLPESCSGFFINVTRVISETEFFANIKDDESLPPSLKMVLKDFEILQLKLTEECSSQPVVQEGVKGHPCCCVNVKNKKWSRSELISYGKHDSSALVVFVDYGNEEFCRRDSLRECRNEWLTLPKMALKFKLADVKKCFDKAKFDYMKALTSCLTKVPLFAEILREHEEVLEVRLLTERNGPLAYQEMIDNQLMAFVQ